MSCYSQFEPKNKLPLGTLISSSYSLFFRGLGDVLKITWLWLLLIPPAVGYADWLNLELVATVVRTGSGHGPITIPHPPTWLLAANYGSQIALCAAMASIAVAWHRRIILGEHPGISALNIFSRSYWNYILVLLAIFLIATIPVFVIGGGFAGAAVFFSMTPKEVAPLAFLLVAILFTVVAACFLRLKLLLPARAVDDLKLTFAQTWSATRGNTWRLFWGAFATIAPASIIALAMMWILVGSPKIGGFLDDAFIIRFSAMQSFSTAIYILIVPIYVGFLSLSYRFLF